MRFSYKYRFFFVMLICSVFNPYLKAQPERYIAGRDYQIIDNPGSGNTPDIIEVEEYFWYGCPGCFQFDPILENWLDGHSSEISFTRIPALWDERREVHAKAYFTAQQLALLESLHSEIFNAMHLEGKQFRNEQELKEFFTQQGVSQENFINAYNSFSVNTAMNRADQKARNYRVRSTPSMIVNGKYLVELRPEILDIVDFLILKESTAQE